MRRFFHFMRRGHWPEFIRLGPILQCRICDVGTPSVDPITSGVPPVNGSPLNNQGLVWRGGFALQGH